MASEKSQESRSDQVFRNDRSWISALGDTATLPRYLSSDHDPLFEFHRWRANLRILEVREVKTVTYVPLSHPFIERLTAIRPIVGRSPSITGFIPCMATNSE